MTPATLRPQQVPLRRDERGVVRVAGTRVTLDTLVGAFRCGFSAEEITEQYPVLALGDVYSAIGYYLAHRAELDAYLETRAAEGSVLRETIGADRSQALRARLLALPTGGSSR